MRNIEEYKLISSHSPQEMISEVNKMISDGWQPFGSPQVVAPVLNETPAPLYSQAMVRYANKLE
jgi:hypothetical protein